jgi:hypothetical protein
MHDQPILVHEPATDELASEVRAERGVECRRGSRCSGWGGLAGAAGHLAAWSLHLGCGERSVRHRLRPRHGRPATATADSRCPNALRCRAGLQIRRRPTHQGSTCAASRPGVRLAGVGRQSAGPAQTSQCLHHRPPRRARTEHPRQPPSQATPIRPSGCTRYSSNSPNRASTLSGSPSAAGRRRTCSSTSPAK